MNSIKILASGMYLPEKMVDNSYFNDKFKLENNWIYKRTGIEKRYWAKEESQKEIAVKAVRSLINNRNIDLTEVGLIIVASTKFEDSMPGISFEIQKEFDIKNCICMDLLAGCSGYINAIDIARKYIELDEIENALVVGVEKLSKYINENDINTAILLGDGAGATLLGKAKNKMYAKNIESIGQDGDVLTCRENEKIFMDGKKVYKFAVEKVTKNVNELLEKGKVDISQIKYIVPHQSNLRILTNIAKRIGATKEQIYANISNVGNTFNASIPIALDEMVRKNLLKENDKILLVGYGGGLNLGSILIEI